MKRPATLGELRESGYQQQSVKAEMRRTLIDKIRRDEELFPGIVGFGKYRYQGRSQGGEWFVMGLSPRAANLTLYLLADPKNNTALLKKLGKHSTGGSCLYIKRLSDVDSKVLQELIEWAAAARPMAMV